MFSLFGDSCCDSLCIQGGVTLIPVNDYEKATMSLDLSCAPRSTLKTQRDICPYIINTWIATYGY